MPSPVTAMARRHHGFLLTALLSFFTAWLVDPATALATRRLETAPDGLAQPPPGAVLPSRDLSERAQELEDQAGVLYSAGRYEEALQAQRDSVASHRQLAAQDPSQRLRLAAALHNLGVVLIRLERKSEAIAPTAEALALYRAAPSAQGGEASLALERPLRNLVLLHYETNHPLEALPLADELVRLHQDAPVEDPRASAALMDVLNLRASLLVSLNRSDDAMRDLQGAVAIARRQAGQSPENPVLRHGLAGSLLNLSAVADLLGLVDQALPPAQEAETLLRPLASVHPAVNGDWAKALSRLGQAYARQGDAARARPALEQAVGLLRPLNPAGPSRTLNVELGGYRDDLALALETLAAVNQRLQRPKEARAAGEEALRLYITLTQIDPRYQRDVERTRRWLTTWPALTPAQR
ncbi:MAG: tetratricopeptide repeat protein [Cyanobacteriota bacterium]|nr:tetratricopeptide repeat protein [Cyanobacteriota bacterium]